nr:MAG TPA: hypothetical protein [Caudoviricetes sp.]
MIESNITESYRSTILEPIKSANRFKANSLPSSSILFSLFSIYNYITYMCSNRSLLLIFSSTLYIFIFV